MLSCSVICLFLSCADSGHGIPSATGTHNQSTVAIARRNIRKIKGKFSMLVTNSQERLQGRINVKKFSDISYHNVLLP